MCSGCSFLRREEKEPKKHPPNQAFPIWKDVVENRSRPSIFKVLVWLSSLCPFGIRHGIKNTKTLVKRLSKQRNRNIKTASKFVSVQKCSKTF